MSLIKFKKTSIVLAVLVFSGVNSYAADAVGPGGTVSCGLMVTGN